MIYLTEHCVVCNIIFGIGFECGEILSTTKISQAHLLYVSFSTKIQINITPMEGTQTAT